MTAAVFDLDDYPTVGDWCYLEDADGNPLPLQPARIVAIAPDPAGRYWAQFADTPPRWPLDACQRTRDRPRPLTPAEQREQFERLFEAWQDGQEDAQASLWVEQRGKGRLSGAPW